MSRHCAKYRWLCSVVALKVVSCGGTPRNAYISRNVASGAAIRVSYFTVMAFRRCGRSFHRISCATSQCSISESRLRVLHFVVASDTATGCRTIATKEVLGKALCRKRVIRMLGGDFSSRYCFERSQYGNQSSASCALLSGVSSSESSVRCAPGEKAKLPGPPYTIPG